MTKLYVAQPMEGMTRQQIEKRRQKIVDEYKADHYGEEVEVLANIHTGVTEATKFYYLSSKIVMLGNADAVLCAKDYAADTMCSIEFYAACRFGKHVIMEK